MAHMSYCAQENVAEKKKKEKKRKENKNGSLLLYFKNFHNLLNL